MSIFRVVQFTNLFEVQKEILEKENFLCPSDYVWKVIEKFKSYYSTKENE